MRQRDRRAVRQRRPDLRASWRCGTASACPRTREIGDPIDLTWARRFAAWASYAFGQPLPQHQPGVGVNAFAHESGIHADGALKDHRNYELYDEDALGPFPADRHAGSGRLVLTGEYGGMAGFRHVMDDLGIEVERRGPDVQAGAAVQRGDGPAADRRRATADRRVPRTSWRCSIRGYTEPQSMPCSMIQSKDAVSS